VAPDGVSPASNARAAPRAEALIAVATLVLVAFHYYGRADALGVYSPQRGWFVLTGAPLAPPVHFAASALLLAVLPVLAARWLTGLSLSELGLGLGRWRAGLAWLAIGIPVALAAGWVAALSQGMRAIYPLDPTLTPAPLPFARYAVLHLLSVGSWEVLFRGVLLFGLVRALGPATSNLTQTALSVVAHFGRAQRDALRRARRARFWSAGPAARIHVVSDATALACGREYALVHCESVTRSQCCAVKPDDRRLIHYYAPLDATS